MCRQVSGSHFLYNNELERINIMKQELIKMDGMEVLEQEFCGDEIIAVKLKQNGKIYVGIKQMTTNIGLSAKQHDRQLANIKNDIVLSKGTSILRVPTKGGNQNSVCMELDYVPLWLAKIKITKDMLESHPDCADKLISYQLTVKDFLSKAFLGKSKEWDLHREVGKVDRKRMTSSISQNIYNAQAKTYSDYTNMVYDVLFGMKAKEIRDSRNINKKSQLTRDYLTKDELKLVDEAETIVTALVSLGFKKDYILDQLRRKFIKKIA